jgi:hypothetical protein
VAPVCPRDGLVDDERAEKRGRLPSGAGTEPPARADESHPAPLRAVGDRIVSPQLSTGRGRGTRPHRRSGSEQAIHRLAALSRSVSQDDHARGRTLHCLAQGGNGLDRGGRGSGAGPAADDQGDVWLKRGGVTGRPPVPGATLVARLIPGSRDTPRLHEGHDDPTIPLRHAEDRRNPHPRVRVAHDDQGLGRSRRTEAADVA